VYGKHWLGKIPLRAPYTLPYHINYNNKRIEEAGSENEIWKV
jgi:hypothetical protein